MKNFIIGLLVILFLALAGCPTSPTNSSLEIPVSVADKDSAEPAIAADSEGNIYVLYVEHGAGKTADVFLQKFGNDAKPKGEKVRVNPEAGRATAWRGDQPTIKIGSEGTIYVGWTARVEVSKGAPTDLYLSVSNDGGKSFQAPVKVNDDNQPASHGMHALEVDKNGQIYLAWLDERYLKEASPEPPQTPPSVAQSDNNSRQMLPQESEPNSEVYFAVSNDNGKTFSANKRIAANVCPCCKVSMSGAPDGRLYVSWRQVLDGDFRHMAVTSSIDGGNSFSPPSIVSDDQWQIAACPMSGASMAVDKNNALRIIWYTAGKAGSPGIYLAESKDGGKSFSSRILISDKDAGGTPVLLTDSMEKYRAIFSAVDKSTYLFAAPNGSFNFIEQNKLNDADQPVAAITEDKVFIAFVRKVGEKRNIFLLQQK
jgi:hypothetical protein